MGSVMVRSADSRFVFVAYIAGLILSVTPLPAQAAKAAPRAGRGRLHLSEFYDAPQEPAKAKPGALIRSQAFDEYDLPLGVAATRILYHSVSAQGEDVAASGVVLVPNRAAPAAGWPILAWAHGFAGSARRCAPSLSRNLGSGTLLKMYVNLGYAVVAPDYAGLGTSSRNAFADLPSHADDVIYSVQAARSAIPQLSSRWVAAGDGAGGAAALRVAEIEAQRGDAGFLGSVSISGVLDLREMFERLADGPWEDTLASLAFGIKTVFPEFELNHMLSDKGLERYQQVEKACAARDASPAVSAGEMLKPDWDKDPLVQSFFERSRLGRTRAGAPLLIISGPAQSGPALGTSSAQVVSRMCREGDQIDFEAYPGAKPGEIVGTSVAAQIAWIKARFSGEAASSNCR